MRHLKGSRTFAVLGVTAVLAVLATGCTASEKSSASAYSSAAATESAPAAATTDAAGLAAAAPAPFAAPSASASAAAPAASSAGPAEPPGSAPAGAGADTLQTPLTGRSVIFTADITVRTTDIKAAVGAVTQIAQGQEGAVFAEQVNLASKDASNPGSASATMTLKVPPTALQGVLDQIGKVGTELGRNENASDVTAQVVDVNSRITAANASLARLRQLFQHAGNVNDLATVENDIAQREADLESLEAQQRTFAAQTAEATITVNLVATPAVAPVVPPVKKAHVIGFIRGLRGGWHAFTRSVSAIAQAVGALLPFVIVLAVLGIVAYLLRRRLMTPRTPKAPSADQA
ncbi:MAG TPA: DUF4349 domain-containing protein [Acidothermaceae bacterium]|nr:DUF4349 domain-containing protein [Acidothermaceae bacterium]